MEIFSPSQGTLLQYTKNYSMQVFGYILLSPSSLGKKSEQHRDNANTLVQHYVYST
jgi:hypothetical protein